MKPILCKKLTNKSKIKQNEDVSILLTKKKLDLPETNFLLKNFHFRYLLEVLKREFFFDLTLIQ